MLGCRESWREQKPDCGIRYLKRKSNKWRGQNLHATRAFGLHGAWIPTYLLERASETQLGWGRFVCVIRMPV